MIGGALAAVLLAFALDALIGHRPLPNNHASVWFIGDNAERASWQCCLSVPQYALC